MPWRSTLSSSPSLCTCRQQRQQRRRQLRLEQGRTGGCRRGRGSGFRVQGWVCEHMGHMGRIWAQGLGVEVNPQEILSWVGWVGGSAEARGSGFSAMTGPGDGEPMTHTAPAPLPAPTLRHASPPTRLHSSPPLMQRLGIRYAQPPAVPLLPCLFVAHLLSIAHTHAVARTPTSMYVRSLTVVVPLVSSITSRLLRDHSSISFLPAPAPPSSAPLPRSRTWGVRSGDRMGLMSVW